MVRICSTGATAQIKGHQIKFDGFFILKKALNAFKN